MKKYLLTGIFGIGLTFSTQAQTLAWVKQITGTDHETGTVITTDANGNVYGIGQFTGTVDVDPGAGVTNFTTVGNGDIYLCKVDAAGNFLWGAQWGGPWGDFSVSITTDKDDNVICSGVFEGTVDFDPGAGVHNMTSTSSGESFIVKLDSAGNFLWSTQRTGYSGYDRNNGIDTDTAGNIYAAGLFAATSDFDPGAGVHSLTSIGGYDIFVQKIDPNGNLLWVSQMGGTDADAVAYGMDADAVGNVWITGYFSDTVDFNPSTAVADTMYMVGDLSGDAFVMRVSPDGNYVWAAALSGDYQGIGFDIAVDEDQNVYSVGTFEGVIDFNPGGNTNTLSAGSGSSGYVSKLDASGNYVWAGVLGGANSDATADAIELDPDNNMYIGGRFESGITDFDPGAGTNTFIPVGSSDIYITKLTSAGDFVWANQFGGMGFDYLGTLEVDAQSNVYSIGFFNDVADFDPGVPVLNLTPTSGSDAFMLKIAQPSTAGIYNAEEEINWIVYPNPASTTVNIQTTETIEQIFIYNAMGSLVQTETNNTFSVAHLAAGIYMLQVKTSNGTVTKRFIKD